MVGAPLVGALLRGRAQDPPLPLTMMTVDKENNLGSLIFPRPLGEG